MNGTPSLYNVTIAPTKDMNEDFLNSRLQRRQEEDAFRQLRIAGAGVDLCSNDYLGIVRNKRIESIIDHSAAQEKLYGSTGSRLISGNYRLIEETEKQIARFHASPSALIFNSGYDANTGLLGSVPQRGDTVLYDQLSHASLRDGIRLSLARSFSFAHNDLADLEKKLSQASGNIFVATESIFSMDGDSAPLREIVALCRRYGARLIVDEAHATGVIGGSGEGLVQMLQLQDDCFARIYTFGKALGCHGAAIACSSLLRDYLINFSRPFIYTTAMPASAVLAIQAAYSLFPGMQEERNNLQSLIGAFRAAAGNLVISESETPIQAAIIPGNRQVKAAASRLQENGFDLRPILSPTVPQGKERLRVVLHAFNTIAEVERAVGMIVSRD